MTDVKTFFQFLIAGLAADGRHSVDGLIKVADIVDLVVPYRANRRALSIESLEEYELLVLRLCAGEAGLARIDPHALAARCREVLDGPEPALGAVEGIRDALLSLKPSAVNTVMAGLGEEEEPPLVGKAPDPVANSAVAEAVSDDGSPVAETRARTQPEGGLCPSCHAHLPRLPGMAYCTGCGARLTVARCQTCRSVVEPGWRHCPLCGQAVQPGGRRLA